MFRQLRRRAALLAILTSTVALSGCGTTAPSASVTETFNGVLVPTASTWHVFTTSGGGDLSITLSSMTPLSGITVGVGLGVAANNACNLQYTQEGFRVGAVWTTSLSNKGSYCVAIYDVGQVSQNVTYSMKVTHP